MGEHVFVPANQELTGNQKGAIAEAAIAAEATKLGIVVSRPNVDARYDLIFDTGNRLLRVQCKWAPRRGDVILIRTRGSWYSPGRGYVRSDYESTEIDAVAAFCSDTEDVYLLPIRLVASQSMIHLRLAETKNGQLAGLHSAAEYRLGAIAQLEERYLGMVEVAGSSPAGSTSPPAPPDSVQVGAHEFRNRFGWYMERAQAGEEFLVTRRGRPYVRLTPVAPRLPEST
jgi:prevent-host-death family protein